MSASTCNVSSFAPTSGHVRLGLWFSLSARLTFTARRQWHDEFSFLSILARTAHGTATCLLNARRLSLRQRAGSARTDPWEASRAGPGESSNDLRRRASARRVAYRGRVQRRDPPLDRRRASRYRSLARRH